MCRSITTELKRQPPPIDEPTVSVPLRVIAMLWAPGYFAEFWRVVQDKQCSHVTAWLHCESELDRYGLPPAYDSYESFRVGKYRFTQREKDKPDSLPVVDVW